ncbi:MAG TPA: transposase, partial [Terriglobales bacterium]|nr:transposase [Terriglobales bacterium]
MPSGLRRYHYSGQSHFLTFSCYRREQRFDTAATYDLFLTCLENMRVNFGVCVYGYVVMPEHVHLLVSEPERQTLGDAMHYLKLSFTKRLREGRFWQDRGYDRNVRNAEEFAVKLGYIHNNPVKRGLVKAADDWKWSSFRHYAFRQVGVVEIESEWAARDRESSGAQRI